MSRIFLLGTIETLICPGFDITIINNITELTNEIHKNGFPDIFLLTESTSIEGSESLKDPHLKEIFNLHKKMYGPEDNNYVLLIANPICVSDSIMANKFLSGTIRFLDKNVFKSDITNFLKSIIALNKKEGFDISVSATSVQPEIKELVKYIFPDFKNIDLQKEDSLAGYSGASYYSLNATGYENNRFNCFFKVSKKNIN